MKSPKTITILLFLLLTTPSCENIANAELVKQPSVSPIASTSPAPSVAPLTSPQVSLSPSPSPLPTPLIIPSPSQSQPPIETTPTPEPTALPSTSSTPYPSPSPVHSPTNNPLSIPGLPGAYLSPLAPLSDPEIQETLYWARTDYQNKHYQAAIDRLTTALETADEAAKIFYFDHRWKNYYMLQQYEACINDLTEVIHRGGTYPASDNLDIRSIASSALQYRAMSYSNAKRYQEALADFERATLPPKARISNYYANYGETLFRLQRYADAEKYFRLALAEQSSVILKMNLASAIASQGRYEEALPLFLEVEKEKPDLEDLQRNIGLVYIRMGKCERARDVHDKAKIPMPSCP